MNLGEFSNIHGGLKLIIRRHLQSRKANLFGLCEPEAKLALRLGRALDDRLQGLSHQGTENAFVQGKTLMGEMHISLGTIVCGTDQRNIDGALATAEGIQTAIQTFRSSYTDLTQHVPNVFRNPGITYPYYGDLALVARLIEKYGTEDENTAFRMHVSGLFPETEGFWTEPVRAVAARLMAAVEARLEKAAPWKPELWDLNWEQMVVLRQLLCVDRPLSELVVEPTEGEVYEPNYGAGIVIAGDNTVEEFNPWLEIGSSAKPAKSS